MLESSDGPVVQPVLAIPWPFAVVGFAVYLIAMTLVVVAVLVLAPIVLLAAWILSRRERAA